MNIEEAQKLCNEYESLKETNRLMKNAIENNNWIAIKTPEGENELFRDAVDMVAGINLKRMQQIEEIFGEVNNGENKDNDK